MYSNNFTKVLEDYHSYLTPSSVRTSELALSRFFSGTDYTPEQVLSDPSIFRDTVVSWLDFMKDSTPINVQVKWATLRATFNGIYEIVSSDFDLHPELSRSISPYVALSPAIRKLVSSSVKSMEAAQSARMFEIEVAVSAYYKYINRLLTKPTFTYSDFIGLRNALIFHLTVAESIPVRVLQQWTYSLANRVHTTTNILSTHANLYAMLAGSEDFMVSAMDRYLGEMSKLGANDITPFCTSISNNQFSKLSQAIVQRIRREIFPDFSVPQLKQFFNHNI